MVYLYIIQYEITVVYLNFSYYYFYSKILWRFHACDANIFIIYSSFPQSKNVCQCYITNLSRSHHSTPCGEYLLLIKIFSMHTDVAYMPFIFFVSIFFHFRCKKYQICDRSSNVLVSLKCIFSTMCTCVHIYRRIIQYRMRFLYAILLCDFEQKYQGNNIAWESMWWWWCVFRTFPALQPEIFLHRASEDDSMLTTTQHDFFSSLVQAC